MTPLIPSEAQTYSKRVQTYPKGCPAGLVSGHGARVMAEDGQLYVDHVSALGPVILGYNDREFNQAITEQLGTGLVSSSLPHALEQQVAELLDEALPGDVQYVRYGKNGADVLTAAVKLARFVTERDVVLSVGYHGKDDWAIAASHPTKGGIPRAAQNLTIRVNYGDVTAVESLLRSVPVACVVVEPITVANPRFDPDFLSQIRTLCTTYGTMLVWDEVVTGFRVAIGGVGQVIEDEGPVGYADVAPDLACYGKAMANGMPISALVGYDDSMHHFEEEVFYSTTFAGELLSLAAAAHTLQRIIDEEIPAQLRLRGEDLMRAFTDLAEHFNIPAYVHGYAARPVYHFEKPDHGRIFGEIMMQNGHLWNGYTNMQMGHDRAICSEIHHAFAMGFHGIRADGRV